MGKFDANGNTLWAKSSTGSSNAAGISVATDAAGSVYVSGQFDGPKIIFGTYTVTNSGGFTTMFLTKFDATGNTLWINAVGGGGAAGSHIGYSVDTYTGGVYVVGEVGSPTAATVFGAYTLTPPPGSLDPMFIGKYDLNGNFLCADILPSEGDDQASVSVDQLGNAYISGDYAVNPFVLGTTTLTISSSVSEDIFTAKYSYVSTVGIEVLQKEDGAIIYPNPISDYFIIKNHYDASLIHIYNAIGQELAFTPLSFSEGLGVKLQQNGIYFVRIGSVTKKIIKSK